MWILSLTQERSHRPHSSFSFPVDLWITGAGHMAGVVLSGEVRKLSCREFGAVVGDDSVWDSMACEYGLQLLLYMGRDS